MADIEPWVREELGNPQLGDERRDRRLLRIVTSVSKRPRGRVSEAIPNAAHRQATYDLLEHDAVDEKAVRHAMGRGTARQCAARKEVLVAVDGSSLSLRDGTGLKGFGAVGARSMKGVGLKVITALAMQPSGKPIGLLAQTWWARGKKTSKKSRPLEARESYHWHEAVDEAAAHIKQCAKKTKLHFLMDREADASALMLHLHEENHHFTIRANASRKVSTKARRVGLKSFMKLHAREQRCSLQLPETSTRAGQRIECVLRFAELDLVMRDRHTHRRSTLKTSVVWLREMKARRPIEWVLYTNVPVTNADDAMATVQRYTQRWQIEEFHRAWKRGVCEVEETQLRSKAAVIKWATIHAVVAARAEKLKHASRETPDVSAATYFSEDEMLALKTLKRAEKKRTETVGDETPTLVVAVRWLADLGGYIGKANGPPGTTVIARGLQRVTDASIVVARLRADGEIR